ncbi:MAG: hypothetical protein ABJP48_10860 [Erythrobacter sp.]
MTPSLILKAGVCLAAIAATPLAAQNSTTADDDQSDIELGSSAGGDGIIVQGRRLRGELDVEQEPLLELNEDDILGEGVTSVADLVTQISNQTGSARGRGGGGRPVILVNGIRVGSFRELASYPPEALARVEVFPEEVAQRFGFSPDRRVINLILKENYSSRELELEFEAPSRGGYLALEQEFGYLKISDSGRINANFEARDESLLTEDERDLIQTPASLSDLASDPDQAQFRSLVADSLTLEGSVSWARALVESGTSLSANINYVRNQSRSLSGLNIVELTDPAGASLTRTFGADDPLERRVSTDTFSASGSLTKPVGAFRLTATLDASLAESETEIDQFFDTADFEAQAAAGALAIDAALPTSADAGFDVARARNLGAESKLTLRGPLANLPAGELLATFDAGYNWTRIESSDTRTLIDTELTRGDLEGGVNLVVPITSRRNGFADALGTITLNLQGGIDYLSDFGTLLDWTAGLTWSPIDRLELSATYIRREVAPSLANLGNPEIETLNAPVFDFINGETVLATVITGGNSDLLAETQTDWRFALNWQLPFLSGTRFTAEYIRNRSDDVTSVFPALTDDIEAAFADRITRDPVTGQLLTLDRRPVTFAETRVDRLQFSLSTRGSFGGARPRGGGGGAEAGGGGRPGANRPGRPQAAAAGGGRRPGGPGTGGGAPSADQRAQFQQFRQRICADDGLNVLTQLVNAIESGEDLSGQIPNFDPQRFERLLSRARDENGEITPERLAEFRERICSFDPAALAGRGQGGRGAGGPGQAGAQPQGGGQQSGPGSTAARNPIASGFGRDGRGRYFVNLTHTVELASEILIAPGVPELDLLDGDATGQFGQARNATRLEAGIFRDGKGLRISGRYTGSARIDGTGLPGSTDLFFDDLATVDVRLFADLGPIFGREDGFLKNLRVSLRADNIFDAQRRVTDSNGDTPINFQPLLIDPVGRFLGIDLRKIF